MLRTSLVMFVALLSLLASHATGQPAKPSAATTQFVPVPEPAEHKEPVPWNLATLLKHVPPLRHDASGRLAMISHLVFRMSEDDKSFEEGKPLSEEMIKELVQRGLTQRILPDVKYIPYAQALQKAGAQVIVFQGMAFNDPVRNTDENLHVLPKDFRRDPRQPAQQPRYPCPLVIGDWRKKADELRKLFKAYKDAGIEIAAVWWDWEVEPYAGRSRFREAAACARCRKQFPPGVLDDFARYRVFISNWRRMLFSTYMVAPVLEHYPKCSVTNWAVVISSLERPTHGCWGLGRQRPRAFKDVLELARADYFYIPGDLGMFNTANPVVYGNTLYYRKHWKKGWNWPLDAAHMDRVYTHVMLGQISAHADNAQRLAPDTLSVPWVDRYCPDDRDEKIPILSRPRYREILRHCWLRGADSMQIFNIDWSKDPRKITIATEEIEDAVAVYDEMLAYRPFLEGGSILNTHVPDVRDDGPVWSGLRLGDRAVVRTFTMGAKTVPANVRPFDHASTVTLDCPSRGATYLLRLRGGKVKVEALFLVGEQYVVVRSPRVAGPVLRNSVWQLDTPSEPTLESVP